VVKQLTFLLDTNEIIPAEPFRDTAAVDIAALLSRCMQYGHRVVVHPANRDDLNRVKDDAERAQKLAALLKYPMLQESPITDTLTALAGPSLDGSNDHRDLRLLAAVESGAATYLVTEDRRLRRRANRAQLGPALASLQEALELLDQLHPTDAVPPKTVRLMEAYTVDYTQEIFDSLREDYPEFDIWFKTKVATDAPGRRCWVVVDENGRYDAIALLKIVDRHPDHEGAATKLSTFKVSAHRAGEKVGELLLRAVLEWCAGQPDVHELFVEVREDPSKAALVRFLEQFGFRRTLAATKANGDVTYLKSVDPPARSDLKPYQFHVAFGPPAIHPDAHAFVIPIKPHWYQGLFPDSPTFGSFGAQTLGGLGAPPTPFGNAIRKAYLCHSPTKLIPQGSTLLFYRSGDTTHGASSSGAVQAIGVVERTMRTAQAERILSFVGRRTVYSAEDVVGMCQGGHNVLATLFRHDHFLSQPWSLRELIAASVLNGAPQSVTRIKSERGLEWLSQQMNA